MVSGSAETSQLCPFLCPLCFYYQMLGEVQLSCVDVWLSHLTARL